METSKTTYSVMIAMYRSSFDAFPTVAAFWEEHTCRSKKKSSWKRNPGGWHALRSVEYWVSFLFKSFPSFISFLSISALIVLRTLLKMGRRVQFYQPTSDAIGQKCKLHQPVWLPQLRPARAPPPLNYFVNDAARYDRGKYLKPPPPHFGKKKTTQLFKNLIKETLILAKSSNGVDWAEKNISLPFLMDILGHRKVFISVNPD